jgi:hypothetical protein
MTDEIYSLRDYLFGKPKNIHNKPGIFRNVPGRFPPIAGQVSYGMSLVSVTLAVANQEYEIQGIATMSAITFKARGGAVQLSLYEGQSNSVYTLIADAQALEVSAIPAGQVDSPLTFYVRSTTAGAVIEILGLRMI